MKRSVITIIAIFTIHISPGFGQCLQQNFSPGRIFKSTGIPELDVRINQEGNLIHSCFGIAPNLLIFDDGGSPNAFAIPTQTMPGYTGTVAFGAGLLRDELWKEQGGHAVAGIMAHEFGHILQATRRSSLSGKNRELHADYLAGYYLGQKRYITPTNIEPFARSLFSHGDYNFRDPSHHGTPEQRVAAMRAGFNNSGASITEAFAAGERFVGGRSGSSEEDPGSFTRSDSPSGSALADARQDVESERESVASAKRSLEQRIRLDFKQEMIDRAQRRLDDAEDRLAEAERKLRKLGGR